MINNKYIKCYFRRETFQNIVRWLEEAKQNGNPEMSFMLVGNKKDLEEELFFFFYLHNQILDERFHFKKGVNSQINIVYHF